MSVMVVFLTELFRAKSGKGVITSKTVCSSPKEYSVFLELPIRVIEALLFGKGGNLTDCRTVTYSVINAGVTIYR